MDLRNIIQNNQIANVGAIENGQVYLVYQSTQGGFFVASTPIESFRHLHPRIGGVYHGLPYGLSEVKMTPSHGFTSPEAFAALNFNSLSEAEVLALYRQQNCT